MSTRFAYILITIFILSSCKKEEYGETHSNDPYGGSTIYSAYFKGVFTDGVTGLPLSGYIVSNANSAFPSSDTLINGQYILAEYRGGENPYGVQDSVRVHIKDSNQVIIQTIKFGSDTLVDWDTVTINFQVYL